MVLGDSRRERRRESSVEELATGRGPGKGKKVADRMQRRRVDVLCVRKRPGGRATRLESLEQGSNCTIMVWIGREMESASIKFNL